MTWEWHSDINTKILESFEAHRGSLNLLFEADQYRGLTKESLIYRPVDPDQSEQADSCVSDVNPSLIHHRLC